MHAIVAEIGAHSTVRIGEHHAVVHEREAAAEREATQPFVQLANLRAWIEIAAPEQLPRRRYARQATTAMSLARARSIIARMLCW